MTEVAAKQKPALCSIKPNGLAPCWALDEVLELGGQGTRYQGLKLLTMIDMGSHKFARHLVALKSGKHSKKGLVLNFCPYCRGELVAGAAEQLTTAQRPEGER